MSYSQRELNTLSYVVSFFDTCDYKLIAPLIRKEFDNVRTVCAYVSRMYALRGSVNLTNQNDQYNQLTLNYLVLRNALQLEDEEDQGDSREEVVGHLYNMQSDFHHYKIQTKQHFLRVKKLLQEANNKVSNLEIELAKEQQDAKTALKKLKVFKRKVKGAFSREKSEALSPLPQLKRSNAQFFSESEKDDEKKEKKEIKEELEPKYDQELMNYVEQMEKDMRPRTTAEWKKNPMKTKPTYPVYVTSETDKKKKYQVRYVKKTNSYYCECLAWKYQNRAPNSRTCKHIRSVYGKSKRIKK